MEGFSDGSSILPISTKIASSSDEAIIFKYERSCMKIKRKNNTYSIRADQRLLSKDECSKKAEEILREKYIIGMTEKELSHEIYFHAWAYQIASSLEKKNNKVLSRVKKAADPIDLADYGDIWIRKMIYNLFWLFPQKHFDGEPGNDNK